MKGEKGLRSFEGVEIPESIKKNLQEEETGDLKLFTFKKGVHPEDWKKFTNAKAIEELPLPDMVYIPLQQHIGAPCKPLVQKGDRVKTGQKIAESDAFVSAPIHSSITGTVKKIAPHLHPMGTRVEMIQIERDKEGEEEWELLSRPADWKSAPIEELRAVIKEAGIVGLGGAGFPTHVKLSPPKDKTIDSFLLNGVECEPYLTSDHRIMLEKTDEILEGMAILIKILGNPKGYIGIENNKPDAIEKMQERVKALGYNFEVCPLEVKYPQGAEKMLISAVLGRTIPAGKLPMDVGVVVNNTATAMAVKQAVVDGKPLLDRVVTVSGSAVIEPKNLNVRLGTPVKALVEASGGLKPEVKEVYQGGPMMGISMYDLSAPIIKATGGVIGNLEVRGSDKSYNCIKCNSCINVCPVFLLPTKIARFSEVGLVEEAGDIGLLSSIECGSCAFVCPSHIPLVQWIRVGKLKLHDKRRKEASKAG